MCDSGIVWVVLSSGWVRIHCVLDVRGGSATVGGYDQETTDTHRGPVRAQILVSLLSGKVN